MLKQSVITVVFFLITNVKWIDCGANNYDQCAEIPSTVTKNCPSVTSVEENEIGRLNFSMPTEKEIAKDGNVVGIVPQHYKWVTDFRNDTNFEGRTKILIKTINETKRIVLNAFQLKIYPDSIYIYRCSSSPAAYICISKFGYSEKDTFIILDLATSLKPNEMYILDFRKYEGAIGHHDLYDEKPSAGIWRNNFDSSTWAVATIFQMRNARKAFPCFDYPSLKATFDICIVHSSNTVAMSNTELDKETKMDDGRLSACFKRTPKVSTYVTTVSVMANFTKLVDTSKQPKLEIIFSSSENETKFRWQIAEARRILEYFQTEMHLQYNLTKLGLLNLSPVKFWGIENFGLVSIESGTPANMDNREELIHRILVHEIVHQWLGNVVTVSYWDEICLQEGLTAFLEWTITEKLNLSHISFNKKLKDTLDDTWGGYHHDIKKLVDPIIDKYTRTQGIANYCFNRPPVILNMISYSYGKDIWTKFIRKLVEKYSYSNANLEDWIALLNEVSGSPDAGAVLKSWFSLKGYPIIYARMESPKKVKLEQKLVKGYSSKERIVPVMPLVTPLKVGTQSLLSNTILFNAPQQTLDVNVTIDKWFLIDPDFVTFSQKLYAPRNYIGLLDCFYGPNNHSCKINKYQMEETFSQLCEALKNNFLPWSSPTENDTNVEDWKNLMTKMRDNVIKGNEQYFDACKCAAMLKEDLNGKYKRTCSYDWNNIWVKKKLMKLLERTYQIDNPSNNYEGDD